MSRLSAWLLAARVPTLPAAVVPVVVGTSVAGREGFFQPLTFVLTLFAAVWIQVGSNLANDFFDFVRGADTPDRVGPLRVTQAGVLSPAEVRRGTVASLGLALAAGLYLTYVGGWVVFLIGLLCIAAAVLYTGGPWPLAYHGLGDLFAFVFFGLIAVSGTYYLQAGTLSPLAVAASVPVGLLVTAILVVNNLRDIEADRRASKRTLAVRIGDPATRLQYAALVVGAYLAPLGLWLSGQPGPVFWLPLLSFPLAFKLLQQIRAGAEGKALNEVLKGTARLELFFGLLLAAGLLY